MYIMMKANSGGHGNQFGFECPKWTDVAKSTDGDIKVVKKKKLEIHKTKNSYILKYFLWSSLIDVGN